MAIQTNSLAEVAAAALELPEADRKLLQKILLAEQAGLRLDPESVRASGDAGLYALWNVGAQA